MRGGIKQTQCKLCPDRQPNFMAVFELENLKALPEREICPLYCYKKLNGYENRDDFVLTGGRGNTSEKFIHIWGLIKCLKKEEKVQREKS